MNVYILLDRSGSMESLWGEALGSINGYVQGLPSETNVFLACFDYEYQVLRNNKVNEWKKVTNDDVSPRGGTALFDAAARIMQRAMEDNSEKTVIVIMTDGAENSSKNFNKTQIMKMCDDVQNRKWEIIFLGANFDKISDVATSQFGRSFDKSVAINTASLQNFTTHTLSAKTTAYAAVGTPINFDAVDRKAAKGEI